MSLKNGFSQIFIILGSAIVLLGLFAVSSLVSQNQDNRNKASYGCSETTRPSTSCVISGKNYGWSCNGSSGIWECITTIPVATPTSVIGSCTTIVCGPNEVKKDLGYYNACTCVPKPTPTKIVGQPCNQLTCNSNQTKVPVAYGYCYCALTSSLPTPTIGPKPTEVVCIPNKKFCKSGDVYTCSSRPGSSPVYSLVKDCLDKRCVNGVCTR